MLNYHVSIEHLQRCGTVAVQQYHSGWSKSPRTSLVCLFPHRWTSTPPAVSAEQRSSSRRASTCPWLLKSSTCFPQGAAYTVCRGTTVQHLLLFSPSFFWLFLLTWPPRGGWALYCNDPVCLSVCVFVHPQCFGMSAGGFKHHITYGASNVGQGERGTSLIYFVPCRKYMCMYTLDMSIH